MKKRLKTNFTFPNELASAMMWLNWNCFCTSTTNGVTASVAHHSPSLQWPIKLTDLLIYANLCMHIGAVCDCHRVTDSHIIAHISKLIYCWQLCNTIINNDWKLQWYCSEVVITMKVRMHT